MNGKIGDTLYYTAVGFKGDPPIEDLWRDISPDLSLAQIAGRFSRAAGSDNVANLSVTIKNKPQGPEIRFTLNHNAPHGEGKPGLKWSLEQPIADLEEADLGPSAGRSIAKSYMREVIDTAKAQGCTHMNTSTGKSAGGYAWAQYGFEPESHEVLAALKADMLSRISEEDGKHFINYKTLKKRLTNDEYDTLHAIDTARSSDSISEDMKMLLGLKRNIGTVEGRDIKVAQAALLETQWAGVLNLDEQSPSFQRFAAYTDYSLSHQHSKVMQ